MAKKGRWTYRFLLVACLLFALQACATVPISTKLDIERPPRLGLIGFKVTAPIKHLSSIETNPPPNLDPAQEASLIRERLLDVEKTASEFLADDLKTRQTVEPVPIPTGLFGTRRGERPTTAQLALLRRELQVDAVLYGKIPWYGRTRLLYPILGEGLDISAESVILGLATGWNPGLVFGNIGFELLTSTPLWFGGYYAFGWAFRPVTVEAWVLSTTDGKVIWHESVDRLISGKGLKDYPPSDRRKKEIQMQVSLHRAVDAVARSLGG